MTFVFFIYGLAFFILGFAIFIYPKKYSAFKLAKDLWLIGAFGILHGINEWIDMFMFIQRPQELLVLKIIRAFIAPLSFICLIQFGTKVIAETKKGFGWIKSLTVILPFAWVFIFALTKERFLYGDVWGRYLLGFAGSILTAYALILQLSNFKDVKLGVVKRNLKIGAAFFAIYAVLAGIIVPKAGFLPASALNYTVFLDIFGFPIQILRTLSAMMIAIFLGQVLTVFNWETQAKLKDWAETLEKRVQERTEELNTANEELNTSNEELKSSNEELATTNEELRVTTEELEQANKELKVLKEDLEKKVEERTAELEPAKQALEKKVADLERFNKLSVGRELAMKELKERISQLEQKLKEKT